MLFILLSNYESIFFNALVLDNKLEQSVLIAFVLYSFAFLETLNNLSNPLICCIKLFLWSFRRLYIISSERKLQYLLDYYISKKNTLVSRRKSLILFDIVLKLPSKSVIFCMLFFDEEENERDNCGNLTVLLPAVEFSIFVRLAN